MKTVTTPFPRTTLLASQMLFRLTIGMLQALLVILVGIYFFGVPILLAPIERQLRCRDHGTKIMHTHG